MKAFVFGLVLVISFCGASLSKNVDPCPEDCNIDANIIRKWIDAPSGFPKGSWFPEGFSFLEKEIYRSGDRVALGIIRAYTLKDLLDPDRLNRILPVMQLSFSQPEFIVRKEDRNPAVTMLLLFALEHDCKEMRLKEIIKDVESYISSQLAKGRLRPRSK